MALTGIPKIPAGASHICPDRGVLGKERRSGFARQTLQIITSTGECGLIWVVLLCL